MTRTGRVARTSPLGGARDERPRRRQRGATLAEFLIVAPVLLGIGGGTLQTGLLYHGRTTLNYAAFEAARAGATRHASVEAMRAELGTRLAPLEGGTGSAASAAAAIARSKAAVASPYTRIRVLNPTLEAFEAWGVTSAESGRRVIPNSHLGLGGRPGPSVRAGVSLQDANLLKIEVTHGMRLDVPVVGTVLAGAMRRIDPEHAAWYDAGLFPLRSVATVRMQSEAWMNESVGAAAAPAPGGTEFTGQASLADVRAPGGPLGGGDVATGPTDGGAGGWCGPGSPPLDLSLPVVPTESCAAAGPDHFGAPSTPVASSPIGGVGC